MNINVQTHGLQNFNKGNERKTIQILLYVY